MLYSPSIPAKKMQREYKKVFEKANKIKKPIVVFSHSKTLGAVIGVELLEQLQLDRIAREAIEEYKRGEAVVIDTPEKLEESFKEMEKEVNDKK